MRALLMVLCALALVGCEEPKRKSRKRDVEPEPTQTADVSGPIGIVSATVSAVVPPPPPPPERGPLATGTKEEREKAVLDLLFGATKPETLAERATDPGKAMDPGVRDRLTLVSGRKVVGSAGVGGATVSGGSVSNASSVVAGMAAGFRRCYQKGLAENPDMKGTVRVTAKIGPNGEVLSAKPDAGAGLSESVKSCVAARVSAAQFAAPDGGGATIVIPVTFTAN